MAAARWRLLTSDGVSAAAGLAADEALLAPYGRRGPSAEAEATLRLYTYRPHCALVGRYQSVEDEVDVDRCRELGVEIGRRPTGGGAIIMGPGQLGVAVASRARTDETPRRMLLRHAELVIAGLAALGVDARFRSKNDLEVDGRKIAGLGLYLDPHGALLFHASVLVDLDVARMLEVLRIPGAKLSDKAVARVEERVTTLSSRLGRTLAAADVRRSFAAGLADAAGIRLVPDAPSAQETARRDLLVDQRYGSDDWVFQRSARSDGSGAALLKTPEGLLRIHVGLHGEAIKSVHVAGDFNLLPPGVARLEGALRWGRLERAAIERAAAASLEPSDLGVAPEAVADAVWKAALNARRRRRTSHPHRTGSCYFPEPPTEAKETPA